MCSIKFCWFFLKKAQVVFCKSLVSPQPHFNEFYRKFITQRPTTLLYSYFTATRFLCNIYKAISSIKVPGACADGVHRHDLKNHFSKSRLVLSQWGMICSWAWWALCYSKCEHCIEILVVKNGQKTKISILLFK